MGSKIEYPGVISRINGNDIQVKILQKTACADCHAKWICSLSDMKEKVLDIPDNSLNFRVGEEVLVTGAASLGMKAVVLAFFLPLLILFISLFAGVQLFDSEIFGSLISVLALVIYYLILYFRRDQLKRKFVFSLNKI